MKKKLYILIITSVFIIITITLLVNLLSKPKFDSSSFELEVETYEYSGKTYKGTGIINCSDKKNDYFVIINLHDNNNNIDTQSTTVIHNGKGEYLTYDIEEPNKTINKPNYKAKVISYLKLNNY